MVAYASPLRYPGGKGFLAPFFESVFYHNNIKPNGLTFVEPYAGGAGAALRLLTSRIVSAVHINDSDENVYNFWKSIFDEYPRFIRRIKDVPLTIQEWKRQKVILDNAENQDPFDKGFAFFYLNRTNHSGVIDARPIGGIGQNGNWKLNARFNKESLISRIDLLANFRGCIQVTKLDGVQIVKHYLGSNNSFLYIDPPYVKQGRNLYKSLHNKRNHEELAKVLNDSRSYRWLLSYDKDDLIDTLYENKEITTHRVYHRLNTRKHDKEYLIHNPELGISA